MVSGLGIHSTGVDGRAVVREPNTRNEWCEVRRIREKRGEDGPCENESMESEWEVQGRIYSRGVL